MKISTSFLASKNMKKTLERLNLTDTDFIHVDVVDGKFVDGNVRPLRKLKKIYKYTSKRLDVHLMVKKPKKYIKVFANMNTEYIVIHVELDKGIEKYLELIKSYGIRAGLAINPDTDIYILRPYLSMIDMILVMSVKPGASGQGFITETEEKLFKIKEMIKEENLNIILSVDGGINDEKVKLLSAADIVIADSFINKSNNEQEQINKLRNPIEKEIPIEIKEEIESLNPPSTIS